MPVEHARTYLRVQESCRSTRRPPRSWSTPAPGRSTPGPSSTCADPPTSRSCGDLAEKIHRSALDARAAPSARSTAPAWRARRGWRGSTDRSTRSCAGQGDLRSEEPLQPGQDRRPRYRPAAWPLRHLAGRARRAGPAFAGRTARSAVESNHCNGCGQCRTEAATRGCARSSAPPGRGRGAAGQGQPAARTCCSDGPAAQLASDEVARGRRPVRQLQDVRASSARPMSTSPS